MNGFFADIERLTLENNNFRKVLYTQNHLQLVLMSLEPGEEIGMETHPDHDQFFRFENGTGSCFINGNEYLVEDGSGVIVPAWAEHNVVNTTNNEPLKFYTIYGPAHHQDWLIHPTKKDAELSDPDFDGKTTE